MAGTQWDKLGQMDAAFEVVAPAIRRLARAEGLRLEEFYNEDPIWRLAFARPQGQARVDVTWEESHPDTYQVRAAWWMDDYETTMRRLHEEAVGEFTRDQPLEELEALLTAALQRVDGWDASVLDRESGPYPDWHRQTREDFDRVRLPRRG